MLLVVATCASCTGEAGPGRTPHGPTSAGSSAPDPSMSLAPSTGATATAAPPTGGAALAALARLPVKGRAPMTGYHRSAFGTRWPDVDHNGCDTRNDILRRDLSRVVFRASAPNCVVSSGVLSDPYSGQQIEFVRGVATSALVQIDHVVALGDAWQNGAQQITVARRTAFANDPLNLLAVGGAVNQAKGDGDAATWLPPRRSYWCAYVGRQIAVKARYGLWVTAGERDEMRRVLSRCPAQPLPLG